MNDQELPSKTLVDQLWSRAVESDDGATQKLEREEVLGGRKKFVIKEEISTDPDGARVRKVDIKKKG